MSTSNRAFLVACSAGKVKVALAPARDLYNSQLFTLARKYAEKAGDPWFILSAKFGLLDPTQPVAPYDESLNDKGVAEREAWARLVAAQVKQQLGSIELVILAGLSYRNPLQHLLEAQGNTVTVPMLGLAIGKQLQFLSRALAA